LVDGYVSQGMLSKTEGVIVKQQTRERAAYARAVRVATDAPERYVALMKQEDESKGSTFLAAMDPVKRTAVLSSAQARIREQRNEDLAAQDRARREQDREDKRRADDTATLAAQKLAEPDKYGPLTLDWLDQQAGQRTMD